MPEIKNQCEVIDSSLSCMNYSGCLDEELTYQYRLESLSYIEDTLIIQN